MRVSLEWLAEYIDITRSALELAEMLTDSGTAVEGVEELGAALDGFVVGHVLEVKPHPAADRLSLCQVDLGKEVADIVCGAPNVRPDIFVPVATPGSSLPDGTPITEATIRGIASRGMLLSEKELGISEEAEGIMILEEGARAGAILSEVLGMSDTVLDLEITPNRPDCLSMLGIAREVAALTGRKLRRPAFELLEVGAEATETVRVEIEDGDLCSRYVARVIEGIRIAPSPWWMRRRLQAAGVRPICNIVDVTNYVMLEMGQPLHAFDLDLVERGHIIVRRAVEGEKMTTLDGVERQLVRDDLLICDPSGPVALAGVMGGEHTEVSVSTARVLLESAHFDPANIMRTARMQDLTSEASYRFERGVDPGGCVRAADRAAFLMQEIAGGSVMPGAVDARARIIEPVRIKLRVKRTARLIGADITGEEMASHLRSIELDARIAGGGLDEEIIEATVPTFRADLGREIDLVEEVARLHGYGRIRSTLPCTQHNIGSLTPQQVKRREIARILAGMGLHEAISNAFISPRWLDILDPAREYIPTACIGLRNPISEEMSVMRPTLLPGLLEAVRFNLNRQVTGTLFFEIGRAFIPRTEEVLPAEPQKLCCALAGMWTPKQWYSDAEDADFFTAKGILEKLASSLHVRSVSLDRKSLPFLHPAQSCVVNINGRDSGWLGMIHPRIASEADLPENTAVLEIELENLIKAALEPVPYEEIPRFPSIQMDLAIVVDDAVCEGDVEGVIKEHGGDLLREVRLFDLYRGEQLDAGSKSLAYSLSFYALDRTLRDEEVRSTYEGIIAALGERLGARLR
jgi:phenylalanyl-tRNA synthetase beta chain